MLQNLSRYAVENVREKWRDGDWKERLELAERNLHGFKDSASKRFAAGDEDDFSDIFRRKTRWELIRISAAVMGIEFCYAAETAFVSPTLLEIGLGHAAVTLVWCLSPLLGFFLTPLLGSMSDRCSWGMGRRRPFVLILSAGIVLGLILVPNGKDLGILLGDLYPSRAGANGTDSSLVGNATGEDSTGEDLPADDSAGASRHPWGIFFTALGTVLLDFDADACQSPSRTYLLDVTQPGKSSKSSKPFKSLKPSL
ncbi:unnamed protein product [Darwinula stevensoni]|uniref:Uncharacterized protein n=1 Tax=Darwinula stevensoni TaxID=69355 RepID=A0A7R9A6R1_9CRUS|nr:unnamed protein product [Darwinula stevensoni]CAG0888616.1 unnamed protein product [Darwinula stevensoni]